MHSEHCIDYKATDISEINCIKELWKALNRHHKLNSKQFAGYFSAKQFEERKLELLDKAKNGELMLVTAKISGKLIGYCISTVDTNKVGEIDSLFVLEEFRNLKIGEYLMKESISWLDSKGAVKKRLVVAAGNERAISFYERLGFYKKCIVLEEL